MSDDLTKLSGPELADWLDTLAAGYDRLSSMPGRTSAEGDRMHEAARCLREDDRVAMRNLERERDGLRERVRELAATSDKHLAYEMNKAIAEAHQFKTTCANQRKELSALNKERKVTLTKLEEAQRELQWQKESCERLRLSGVAEDDSYDPYKRLCDIVDEECGPQPARLPVGTMLSMLETALFEWRKRAGHAERDLKEQLDGNMAHRKEYGAREDETMGQWLARVHAELEALRDVDVELASASKRIVQLEAERDACRGMELAAERRAERLFRDRETADKRIAELEAEVREHHEHMAKWEAQQKADAAALKAALPRKSYPVTMDLTPDCEPIAESPYVAAVAVAHGKSARARIQAAWGACPGTTPLSEPADRKPEWRWSLAQIIEALDSNAEVDGNRSLAAMTANHLRELLDERSAIEALAEAWDGHSMARDLREVLNGKR